MLYLPSEGVTYVIGGGPSLKGFDFSVLKGYKIGANKSAIEASCDCLVSMDGTYANKASKELAEYDGEIILAYMRPDYVKNKIKKARYIKASRERGLSNDPEVVYGLNSGYSALNVAYLKGAKKIGLLGFDMKSSDTKHFHSGYYWDTSKNGNYKAWAKYFDDAAKILTNKNIEVINYVGPEGSMLTQFPTRPLEELDENYGTRKDQV